VKTRKQSVSNYTKRWKSKPAKQAGQTTSGNVENKNRKRSKVMYEKF